MQRLLHLTLNQRTTLVTVDTARAVLGVDAESVAAMVDDGRLPAVWDIALPGAHRRELRIWAGSLEESFKIQDSSFKPGSPLETENLKLETLIGTSRETLRGAEVERLLCCSAQHVQALHKAGEIAGTVVGHTRHITRASLEAFLARRRL